MKRILCSLCVGSLALAITALGQEVSDTKAKSGHTTAARSSASTRTTARATTHVSRQPVHTRTFRKATPRTGSSGVVSRNNVRRTAATTVRERNVLAAKRQRNVNINSQSNLFVNRRQNAAMINRERNIAITNNWRGAQFSGQRYAAFRNYQRQWHDKAWWRSHFNTIVFVNGGWYYWNAGYWYPAWGYAPYVYYPYDGPIYGYNYLSPDQVVVDVQRQLRRDGYYFGPIDGVLGPMTRRAIAAFQADHGLAVTSAIDEPTLATLSLV
jgi:hypothetical protein